MEHSFNLKKIKSLFSVKRMLIIVLSLIIIIDVLLAVLLTIKIINHKDHDSILSELTENVYGLDYDYGYGRIRYKFNSDHTFSEYIIGESYDEYYGTFKIKEDLFGNLSINLLNNYGHKEKIPIELDDQGKIVLYDGLDELSIISANELSKDDNEIKEISDKRQKEIDDYINAKNKAENTNHGFTITNVRNETSGWGDQYQNCITGVVTNHNGITYRQVKLKITLYNKSGQIIGTDDAIIDSYELPDGAKSTFTGTCYTDERADEVRVEVESTRIK